MKRAAARSSAIKFLTPDEMRRLFSVIESKRDQAIFLLAYRHGLRASEVGLLRDSDVDFKRMTIRIQRLKGSESGVNPMQPDEVKVLKRYIRSRRVDSPILFPSNRREPISRKMLDVLMKRYGELANISKEKRHFHVLKHSIATHLLDASDNLRFVQAWIGTANIQNVVPYTHLSTATKTDKARQFFLKLPRF